MRSPAAFRLDFPGEVARGDHGEVRAVTTALGESKVYYMGGVVGFPDSIQKRGRRL